MGAESAVNKSRTELVGFVSKSAFNAKFSNSNVAETWRVIITNVTRALTIHLLHYNKENGHDFAITIRVRPEKVLMGARNTIKSRWKGNCSRKRH